MFETRYCMHGQHMVDAKSMRVIPGGKIKRWICESCYAKRMEKKVPPLQPVRS